MPSFKDRVMGPLYLGPEDSVIMYEVTGFGSRRECTEEEILHRFGRKHPHPYWPESIPEKLERMINEGKLILFVKDGVRYYRANMCRKSNKH